MSVNFCEKEIVESLSTLSIGSFAGLFPYKLWDQHKKIFINKASVMKMAEIPLLSGANEKLIKDLVSIINKSITDDVVVRILRITHHNVARRIDQIKSINSKIGGVYEWISEKQADFLKSAAIAGFNNNTGLNTAILDSRIFIEITKNCKSQDNAEREEAIDHVNLLFEKIALELNTASIPLAIVDAETFLSLIRIFLQFDEENLNFDYSYDDSQYLDRQITNLGFEFSVLQDQVQIKSKNGVVNSASTYNISKFPKKFALYNTADYLAHIDKNASITCPHIFSVAFKLIPDEKAKSHAKSKWFSLEKQANSVMTRLFPKIKDQFEEWTYIRNELERDEVRMVECYISTTLFSKQEDHKKYCSQFESVMKACPNGGFEVAKLSDIQLPLFLSNFPAIAGEQFWKSLKRAFLVRRYTTWNLVNLLPILGDWTGSYNGFVAPGMRNQLSAIDIFSDEVPTDNNNVSIAAGSGAGKSVLTQNMLFHVLAAGGIVFIIDKGDSYKKLCELLGGVYIDGRNLKLNPFTYLDQIKEQDAIQLYFSMIRDLLSTIVSPNGDLDGVSRAYLLEAASLAYESDGKKTNIDSVVKALNIIDEKQKEKSRKNDRRIFDLITLLKEYMTTGMNGQYFNEASTIDPKAKLVVLELGSIDANEDLVRSVLFSLINTISQRMYLSDRSLKKMCIIDEAWSLLSGDNKLASKFIEKGFRTSRKHGGSFVTITQGVTDYFKNECALACWNNSDIKIILRQNDGALKKFNDDHPNIFSDYETYVMSQFKPAKDAGFSSFMLKAGSITSFHRLFLDPYSRILFSTHPAEFQMVSDLIAKAGMNLKSSIEMTAKHFYEGEIARIERFSKGQEISNESVS